MNIKEMSIEQQTLLYNIADWHSKHFYLNMKDYWNNDDFQFDRLCVKTINELETQYIETYGQLPEWKTIDDVFNTRTALSELIK